MFIAIGLFIAVEFYFSLKVSPARLTQMGRTFPILLLATLTALRFSGIYKSLLRYAGTDTFFQAVIATLAGTGITYLISLVISLFARAHEDAIGMRLVLMPRPVYFIQWVITLALIASSRFYIRWRSTGTARKSGEKPKRILIIGAGYAGATVVRDIQNGRYGAAVPAAILDTDAGKVGTSINRVPVVELPVQEAAEQYRADEIIVTVREPSRQLIESCVATDCKVRVYSEAQGLVRELNIADLLGRPETHLDMTEARNYFSGKRVLVTGGGGSIGSELCRQILAFTPQLLILYDISENYMYDLLYELREKFGDLVNNTVRLEVGSVRDEESLWRVMGRYKPQVVIHAAAHKHVPLMEDSPEQAILNNVFGTEKTARVALECGVERFVLISTDKAVNPTNVMGASKRLAEMIINSMNGGKTQFAAVRFGNVLGSHGSVVPIFEKQIKSGGPVTITSPDIIRYFMTIPEAASLVLQAAAMAKGGELFILDMGEPVRIRDLAERMIRLYGTGEEKIVYTGLRPGEKMYEELLLDKENDKATEKDRIYITEQEKLSKNEIDEKLEKLSACLERHGDVRKALAEAVPTYHEGS